MPQPPILPQAPGVQVPARGDAGAVRGPARDAHHPLTRQRLYEARRFQRDTITMTQFTVFAFTP